MAEAWVADTLLSTNGDIVRDPSKDLTGKGITKTNVEERGRFGGQNIL